MEGLNEMSNTVVNTNVLAINSHRNLKSVGNSQSKSSQRLSSGLRINSAADDAAGLAISEKMRAQIRGLDQASTNSQDGISLLQTAEGGMQEIDNMLQRVRELVVQAANDTNDYTSNDRQKIQDEIDSLIEEIDSMQNRVEFNNKKIINGSAQNKEASIDRLKRHQNDYGSTTMTIDGKTATVASFTATQVDGNGVTISTKLRDAWVNNLKTDGTTFSDGITALASEGGAGVTLTGRIDWSKIDAVSATVSSIGSSSVNAPANGVTISLASLMVAAQGFDPSVVGSTVPGTLSAASGTMSLNGLNKLVENIDSAMEALKGAADGTKEAEAYTELSKLKTGIMAYRKVLSDYLQIDAQKTDLEKNAPSDAKSLYLQVGANANQSIQVNVGSVNTAMLNIGTGAGGSKINVQDPLGSRISAQLDTLDSALNYVSAQRSKLGATQNRLEYTINSLDVSSENLTAAESRIRDTDMAKEMMNLTKSNVLQQAATSMLAQANQAPQNVLQLLQ